MPTTRYPLRDYGKSKLLAGMSGKIDCDGLLRFKSALKRYENMAWWPIKPRGYTMKKPIDKKKQAKARPCIYNELNAHTWATKMEIRRQLSSRPDMKK